VDFEKRDRIPKSPSNLFGPDHRNDFAYARIVSSLGRLGTPEAARRLIAAFDDCAPHVRQAACLAAREIRFDLIDEETGRTIRDLVRERLSDDASWVAGEAALCVDKLGIGDL
jgi:HEAT repeat protein